MIDQKMKAKTAWAYLVVSTEDQSDTLPNQLAWAKDTSEKNGWTLERVFDGVASGKLGVRTKFEEMLTALKGLPKDDRPAYVLLTRLDRIGRGDLTRSMVALQSVKELGPRVWSREENGEVKVDGAMMQLIAAVKFAVAAQENEVRIDKAKAEYDRRRKARAGDSRIAVSNAYPYGLTFKKKQGESFGRVVPKDPEAAIVRRAFKMRAAGKGCYIIGKALRDIAPPMELRNGQKQKMAWDGDFCSRMFKKHVYVEAGLIDEATFQKAQRNDVKQSGSAPRKYHWPLTGALRCECGTALMGMRAQPHGKEYRWYACRDRKRAHGKLVCHNKADIEAQFLALLRTFGRTPALLEVARNRDEDESERRRLLMARLSTLRTELSRIPKSMERVWEAFDSGNLATETVQRRVDALEAKEKNLTAEAATLDLELRALNARQIEVDEAREVVQTAEARWSRAGHEEKKAMAKRVAGVFGGSLVVTADGTLEGDLMEKVIQARIAVRARRRKAFA
ncbi:MAG TPA: recombinase family protein [Candidatus Tumulicola sp.]|nr:recombinase family protein [Candidatus Tumulicola sp.]